MNKPKLLVVGSMNMDLCMYGLQGLPAWGVSTFCTDYRYAAGGKGFNQAYAAAKQGAEVYMAGCIGRDENGKLLLRHLAECGVHDDYVAVDDEYGTGLSTMNMGEAGRYFSIYVPGANDYLKIETIERALQDHSFDMIVMQLEMPREVIYRICEIGAARGTRIFLDAGPAMSLPLEKLRGTFVLSPNEAETEALTGIVPDTDVHILEAAKIIYEQACPEYVLLKLGGRGACLYDGKSAAIWPGFRVNAIDTTAAGDTFGAAFCVQYCMKEDLGHAIRIAHAAAAICVTRKGGQPSIPSREEAEAFYSASVKRAGIPESRVVL